VKRAIVMALSVILALIVAAPIASGQETSQDQNLGELTAAWWSWAMTDPSPLEGNYKGGEQCEGEFVEGVFFLAGTTGGTAERTCTVPADTPLLFPVVNVVCSEAFTNPPDPKPYTKCAKNILDAALEDSETFATLDGQDLQIQRIASGRFDWTIESDNNPFGLPAGTYDAASDGLWVYLPEGLEPGKYTLEFGGSFFGGGFSVDTTYTLRVVE
jgi:hypothetical protein